MTSATTMRGKKVVYVRQCNTRDPFAWLGKCSRLGAVTSPRGDITHTYRKAVEVGKFEVDQAIRGTPGATSSTLIMKETVHSALYGELATCPFDVDVRYQNCGRVDDPFNWEQIKRLCCVDVTSIDTDDETAFTPDDQGETLITAALSTLEFPVIINKVTGTRVAENDLAGYTLQRISKLKDAKCADECGPAQDCWLIAIAVAAAPGNPPYYAISMDGGHSWTLSTIPVFTTATVLSDIGGVGDFIVAVAAGEPGYAYSWDGGASWALVDDTVMTDFTAHPPMVVKVYDFQNVLIGGADGYLWLSADGAVTFSTVDGGVATSEDIINISYASDSVVYAVGATNTAKKSINAGLTWAEVTLPVAQVADTPAAVYALDDLIVLVGYSGTGGLWYTLDGGDNWLQDTSVSGTTKVYYITGCGCGVLYAAGEVGGVGIVMRNIDYGAPARWLILENDVPGTTYDSVACCDQNYAVAVGAATGIYSNGNVTLIS